MDAVIEKRDIWELAMKSKAAKKGKDADAMVANGPANAGAGRA